MIILMAADNVYAKDTDGKIDKRFSFRAVIEETMKQAHRFGYRTVVYDMGELGIGKPFQISSDLLAEDDQFDGYLPKTLFKPDIVRHCLKEHGHFTVYADGDVLLYDRIDEIESDDYDIGVTLRRRDELESEWHREHFEMVKYVNAGVIFFNPTPAAFKFIDIWKELTIDVQNDQKALNLLVCSNNYPEAGSIEVFNGVRVKYFSGEQYNFYYFDEGLPSNIKMLHFKGNVRKYYPFDWKVRLYCKTLVPLLNKIRPLIKKILFRV